MNFKKLNISVSEDNLYKILFKECYNYWSESNHPSTRMWALLISGDTILLKGKNILPIWVKEKDERFEWDNKHIYLNHAERDVIYKAAKGWIKTEGLTMIMPWLPCISCANAIISSWIKELIVHKQMIDRKTKDMWKEELKKSLDILNEAGIQIIAYDWVVWTKAYMHWKTWEA